LFGAFGFDFLAHSKQSSCDGNNILAESGEVCQSGDDDPSWWNDEDWLMAFDLAFDEGGNGSDLLVSMQLGTVERARKLRKRWSPKLRGLPYFHSCEFDNISSGIFKGRSKEQREKIMNDLCVLIHRHLTLGATTRIDTKMYDRVTTPAFRSRWGTAYTFSINTLSIIAWIYFRDRGVDPDVNILIEDGHRNSAQAVQYLEDSKKLKGKRGQYLNILTVWPGSKKDHPTLQAADMLAYGEWQKITQHDLRMFNALHMRQPKLYRAGHITITEEMIGYITESAAKWTRERKEFGRKRQREHEEFQRTIRELRSDDEEVNHRPAQRDSTETGSGESSKKAEA
jgi:hypothetical protein